MAADFAAAGGGEDFRIRPKFDAFSRLGDSGGEQFPGQNRAFPIWRNEQNTVKSRALVLCTVKRQASSR